MDYLLDDELEMLRQSAAEYAERELAPHAARLDAEERFPEQAMRAAAEAGFLGLVVPEEYGGAGLGNLHAAILLEEINAVDASVGVTISVHMSLASSVVARYGSEEQKQRWLPDLASGARIGAYCLTEPEVGSDAASIRTRAEKVDGGWKISGTKAWITTAAESGMMIVYAVTDPDAPRGQGISAFLVDPASDGVAVGKKEHKLGLRASSTSEVVYDKVFVSDADLLGDINGGFKIALSALDGGRIGIAAQSLGIHRACLDACRKYAQERKQFGKTIGEFQAVAFKIADMATEMEAARLLVHRAAWMRDQNIPATKYCSMAKLYASQACNRAAQDAVQIHGGAGYTKEFPVERYYRDARITEIYEGATDIQRIVISRRLLTH